MMTKILRFLILSVAVLCVAAPAFGQSAWPTSKMKSSSSGRGADGLAEFDLLDYAPNNYSEADVASGCDYDTLAACTTPSDGSGTDFVTILENAAADAAAAGGGIINVPPGDYRFGDQTSGTFQLGAVITQDNIWLNCSPGARLLPAGIRGGHVVNWCHDSLCTDEGTTDRVQGGGIIRCELFDDDPEYHGHGHQVIDANGGLAGGTPAAGDSVSWLAGARTGIVAEWDAVADEIRVKPTSASLLVVAGDDITDGTWTITDVGTVSDRSEESGGAAAINVENWTAYEPVCTGIGDECIDTGGRVGPPETTNRNVQVIRPTCRRTPSMPSAGSCINLANTDGGSVLEIDYREQKLGAWSLNKAISIGANAAVAGSSFNVEGGYIETPAFGVSINPNNAAVTDLTISGVTVNADTEGAYALHVSVTGLVGAKFIDNNFNGLTLLKGDRLTYHNNRHFVTYTAAVEADALQALDVDGITNSDITGNEWYGFPAECVKFANNDGIRFSGNTCKTNADTTREAILGLFSAGTCTNDNLEITDNHLEPIGYANVAYFTTTGAASCENVEMSRNRIIMNTLGGGDNAIRNVTTIRDNTITMTGPGDAAIETSSTFPCTITGNKITMGNSNTDGIVIDGPDECLVENNRIEGVIGATGYAIEERSGDLNRFIDNHSSAVGGGATGAVFNVAGIAHGGCNGSGAGAGSFCEGNTVGGEAQLPVCNRGIWTLAGSPAVPQQHYAAPGGLMGTTSASWTNQRSAADWTMDAGNIMQWNYSGTATAEYRLTWRQNITSGGVQVGYTDHWLAGSNDPLLQTDRIGVDFFVVDTGAAGNKYMRSAIAETTIDGTNDRVGLLGQDYFGNAQSMYSGYVEIEQLDNCLGKP